MQNSSKWTANAVSSPVTTTYCYDYADRLVSSSDPGANGATYDSHGNTTQIGTGSTPLRLTYNSLDANSSLVSYDSSGNGSGMYYARDVTGRIVYREHDNIANSVWTLDTAQYYGYTGPGDSPDFVRDGNWNITDKYLQLPGGVMVDIRPQQSGNAAKQYTLPSIEGRTLLTLDAAGTNTSTGSGPISSFAYDPFGNAIGSLPANAQNGSYGFGGSLQKMTETTLTLMPIQMGARVYFPTLGRFAQVDPVDGGTANRYVYVLDPVNGGDYSGMVTIVAVFTVSGPIQGSSVNPQSSNKAQAPVILASKVTCGCTAIKAPARAKSAAKRGSTAPNTGWAVSISFGGTLGLVFFGQAYGGIAFDSSGGFGLIGSGGGGMSTGLDTALGFNVGVNSTSSIRSFGGADACVGGSGRFGLGIGEDGCYSTDGTLTSNTNFGLGLDDTGLLAPGEAHTGGSATGVWQWW